VLNLVDAKRGTNTKESKDNEGYQFATSLPEENSVLDVTVQGVNAS
jgi:hypothetical protein